MAVIGDIALVFAGPIITMGELPPLDLPKRRGQGFGNIAEDHMIIIGMRWMRGDAAVENEYIAVGEQFRK